MPVAITACLSDREVVLLVDNRLGRRARARARRHLDECAACLVLVAELVLLDDSLRAAAKNG